MSTIQLCKTVRCTSSAALRSTRLYAKRNKLVRPSRDKYSFMTRPEQPALVAFDLDGTLWDPEMYLLDGRPHASSGRNTVLTKGNDEVHMLEDTHEILQELCGDEWSNTHVAYVSRTTHANWAKTCLQLLQVTPNVSMDQLGALQEIYPGTKTEHFKKIHDATSIPYKNMLFFDNEMGNIRDVSRLGVTCIYTPRGMTMQKWRQGLQQFSQNASPAGVSAR